MDRPPMLASLKLGPSGMIYPRQNFTKRVTDVYELGDVVGEGTFAEVRLAKEKKTGEQYAVKVIDKDYTGSLDMLEETRILAKLNHKNIVAYKEMFSSDDKYFVILEYVCGGELLDRIIKLNRYTEKHAADVIKQALLGIRHMHDKHYTHNDLKPENLLLGSKEWDAELKIADFGYARHHTDDIKEVIGTLPYMAPETVMELPHGKEVDIWSLGVVMYVLLSGFHPFQSDDDHSVVASIIAWGKEITWYGKVWHKISDNAKDLLRKMLCFDRTKRISAKDALKHPWILDLCSDTSDVAECPELPEEVAQGIRKLQARRRLKAAMFAVRATKRLEILNRTRKRKLATSRYMDYLTLTTLPLPKGINIKKRESYLSPEDFKVVLGCEREKFYKLPLWKQDSLKRSVGLF